MEDLLLLATESTVIPATDNTDTDNTDFTGSRFSLCSRLSVIRAIRG